MKWAVTIFFLIAVNLAEAHDIVLLSGGHSAYRIGIPANPTKQEIRASLVVQEYFKRVSGIVWPIDSSERIPDSAVIFLQEFSEDGVNGNGLSPGESYSIRAVNKRVVVRGGANNGLLYGAYGFVERILGCRKLYAGEAYAPRQLEIRVAGDYFVEASPAFLYREVYLPEAFDQEYLDWHGLHRFEARWGLWGHSFDRLIPADRYFKEHPEFYALVNGKRTPGQLCLSNDTVFRLAVADLRERMENAGDALYWSVSANDQGEFCTCDRCRSMDEAEGGPQGSLINFVNRIARIFPEKRITTLAYNQTKHPPLHLVPEKNVFVFISTIDSYKHLPLPEEKSAATFRRDLEGWRALTPNILVWDYITQFTNYLVPFPNHQTFSDNIQFFTENEVKGILMQGSGETRSDFQELKSYLLAKLLWNPRLSAEGLIQEFVELYYQNSAPYVRDYIRELHKACETSQSRLDIYGSPVNSAAGYLSPSSMDIYSRFMDKAEAAVEGSPMLVDRIAHIRLGHEYSFLQQAKYYYRDKHGIFKQADNGRWVMREGFDARVSRFCALAGKYGVLELSEGGMSPGDYLRQWNEILSAGYRQNKAEGAKVMLTYPAVEDYMRGAPAVLCDGKPGFPDFSFNWLVFEDVPMMAEIDLGKAVSVDSICLDFLHDPAHRYHVPNIVVVQYSLDGVSYNDVQGLGRIDHALNAEGVRKSRFIYALPLQPLAARFIRVSAKLDGMQSRPDARQGSKIKIACDEVWLW